MAYVTIDRKSDLSIKQDDLLASKRYVIERKPDIYNFYELEEAVVLDIVLDEEHPAIQESCLDSEDAPPNIDGKKAVDGDLDYSWIGRIKFRFLNSQVGQSKESLDWAYPMENTGVIEYPLMNEVVIVAKYMNSYYYTRKLNTKSVINSNASFVTERAHGLVEQNLNEYELDEEGNPTPYDGPVSKLNFSGGQNYEGVLGSYFKFNSKIRTLKKFEGDTLIESRFGSSIRFGAYDDTRENDNGVGEYSDGGGNPMILIRNRQSPIKGPSGASAKGYTIEDINKDGSSIHMTSGKTVSNFMPEVGLVGMFNITRGINPPTLDGDQIIFNSDRLVFSSRAKEMLFYSKGMIGMSTDSIISLNSNNHTTITSKNGVITLNAKKVYLNLNKDGANDQPVLLGRTTTLWLYSLCDWMLFNVNNQIRVMVTLIGHFHLAPPPTFVTFLPAPPWIVVLAENLQSLLASQITLITLRSQLPSLMSSRVFVGG